MTLLTDADLTVQLISERDVKQLQHGCDVFGRVRFSTAAYASAVDGAHNSLTRDQKLAVVLKAMRGALTIGISSTAVVVADYGGASTLSLRVAFALIPTTMRGDYVIGLSASETFPGAWSADLAASASPPNFTPIAREKLYMDGLLP